MKKIITILIIIATLISISSTVFSTGEYNYILDSKGQRIPIATTYTVGKVQIFFGTEVGPLNNPRQMFVDSQDKKYIVDSGNHRVLKFDNDWNIELILTEADGIAFKNPQGIYVDAQGYIFIADTDNNRIVHMAPTGEYIEEFVKPDSELYDNRYAFRPMRLAIDPVGQIYIINMEDYHGYIILDAKNIFRGYVAPTRLAYNPWDKIVEFFATPEQKERIARRMPPVHSSLVICDRGTIYTTTRRTEVDQFKRFSNIGVNIYPVQGVNFGETRGDYVLTRFGVQQIEPNFVDLAVDDQGIISLLDSTTGRIYQYDNDGMLLGVFGGKGTWAGKFISPVSISDDSYGNIYVLDSHTGSVHIFNPTNFLRKVHSALALYYDGKYEEAIEPWQEILAIDSNYAVAHIGMGKAYMKQENWDLAMESYRAADDKTGYSQAFRELRQEFIRNQFGFIILFVGAVILGLIKLFVTLRKRQKNLNFEA